MQYGLTLIEGMLKDKSSGEKKKQCWDIIN